MLEHVELSTAIEKSKQIRISDRIPQYLAILSQPHYFWAVIEYSRYQTGPEVMFRVVGSDKAVGSMDVKRLFRLPRPTVTEPSKAIMKPWTKLSEVPLDHWFVCLQPNGDISPYYQRITDVRMETMGKTKGSEEFPVDNHVEVGFRSSWWDIEKLLGQYKHMAKIGDEPMDCGTNV